MGKEAKYVVRLDGTERQELETLLATPRAAAERVLRARMLLKADEGERGHPAWTDTAIADLRDQRVEDSTRAARPAVVWKLGATLTTGFPLIPELFTSELRS